MNDIFVTLGDFTVAEKNYGISGKPVLTPQVVDALLLVDVAQQIFHDRWTVYLGMLHQWAESKHHANQDSEPISRNARLNLTAKSLREAKADMLRAWDNLKKAISKPRKQRYF